MTTRAVATGFIGAALRSHRAKAFLSQEQQRARMGIGGQRYDASRLRLQTMQLPRSDQFAADLPRIGAKIQEELGMMADLDLEPLEKKRDAPDGESFDPGTFFSSRVLYR